MKVEVLISRDYNDNDVSKMMDLFQSHGYEPQIDRNRMIRESVESLPPAIWLFLTFASAAVLSGFFNKAGSDAWDKLKDILRDLSKKKEGKDPQIRVHNRVEGREIIIPIVDDPMERETAFNLLPQFLSENPNLDGWIIFSAGQWKKLSDLS